MADKTINELTAATTMGNDDLLVLQQGGTAKKLSGKKLGDYVYNAAAEKVAEVNKAVDDARSSIDDIVESVQSMTELGTDTTLTITGMAADAKAAGDKIKAVETAAMADLSQGTVSGSIATITDGADNIPIKKMTVDIEPVQSGSGDPSPENIRPITGWTGANVTRTGKNLIDVRNITGSVMDVWNTDGTEKISRVGAYLPYLPAGTYTFRCNADTIVFTYLYVQVVDGNENFVAYYPLSTTSSTAWFTKTIDIPKNGRCILYSNSAAATVTGFNNGVPNTKLQVEVGTEATEYEEPIANTYNITFPSEAGTVYGGKLEINEDRSGALTVDKLGVTVTGSDFVEQNTASTGNKVLVTKSEYLPKTSSSNIAPISNIYRGGITAAYDKRVRANSTKVYVYDNSFESLEDGQAFFNANPLQVVYSVATPDVYQLTPTEVKTLFGVNNIWADTGDISEFVYRKAPVDPSYVDTKIAETDETTRAVIESMIAGRETAMTATKNYTFGSLVIVNDILYKLDANVASGETLTPGTNCHMATVEAEIAGCVPNYRSVNGKDLSSDVTLTAEDIAYDDSLSEHTSDSVGEAVSDLKESITQIGTNNQGLIPLSFTLTQNKMIDGTDGAERVSNTSRYASDAINVENLTKINLYSAFRGNYGAAFYDEHNMFISGVIAADGYNEQPYLYSLDVPSSAKYFRFTVYVVNMPYTDAYLCIPSTHDDFKNYVVTLNGNNKSEYSLAFTLTSQKMIDGRTGTEYAASALYSASNQVNVEGLTKIILYSAFNSYYGCAFYDANGGYISGAVVADGYSQQPYTYELDVPSTAKYFRFTVCSINMTANSATLKVPIAQTDIVNSIKALKNTKVSNDTPITDIPVYIRRNLCNKRIGELSKGYICLIADDGKNELATYTIPMLTEKNVPCTFSLIPTSEVITDATNLQTVLTAINNGCSVAMHGTTQWVNYTESALNKYFDDAEATFTAAGITNIEGAVCPGGSAAHDTNELIQCVAGGRYNVLCSGGTTGEITYGSYSLAGPRTNIFAIKRYSAIGFTESTYKAAIDYAYDNHLILLPFWHDNTIGGSLEYQAIIEGMIDYAKTKGLEFITLGQIATVI